MKKKKQRNPPVRKIDDSKAEGNVPKSAEVPGAAILFFTSIYLLFFAGSLFKDIERFMIYIYSFIGVDLNGAVFYEITSSIISIMLVGLFPLFFFSIIFGCHF